MTLKESFIILFIFVYAMLLTPADSDMAAKDEVRISLPKSLEHRIILADVRTDRETLFSLGNYLCRKNQNELKDDGALAGSVAEFYFEEFFTNLLRKGFDGVSFYCGPTKTIYYAGGFTYKFEDGGWRIVAERWPSEFARIQRFVEIRKGPTKQAIIGDIRTTTTHNRWRRNMRNRRVAMARSLLRNSDPLTYMMAMPSNIFYDLIFGIEGLGREPAFIGDLMLVFSKGSKELIRLGRLFYGSD